jgi:hypothetical protein
MATVTSTDVTHCALCHRPFLPHRHHGRWQRYCSPTCAQRAQSWAKINEVKAAYGLPDDHAFRQWLITQLNHRSLTAVAGLCGVQRQALYQWLDRFAIRRVTRYE